MIRDDITTKLNIIKHITISLDKLNIDGLTTDAREGLEISLQALMEVMIDKHFGSVVRPCLDKSNELTDYVEDTIADTMSDYAAEYIRNMDARQLVGFLSYAVLR